MAEPVSTQADGITRRYRELAERASELFAAGDRDALLERVGSFAAELFPGATSALLEAGEDGEWQARSDAAEPGPELLELADKTLDGAGRLGGEALFWLEPASDPELLDSEVQAGELPEGFALTPLEGDAGPRLALALSYSEAPAEQERELIETFSATVRDALDELTGREGERYLADDRAGGLMEVANHIASQLELPEVISAVVERASELLGADRSSVWIYDRDQEEIYTIVAQKLETEEIRMPADRGIAGHVLQSGEPLNLEDAYDHPAFNPEHDRATGYRTRSMLCVPLHDRRGEKLGVFQVINKQGGGGFTAADEELLGAVANSASVAIENALLYREQKQQFESFIQVLATTIDSRDPTTGMHTVMVTGIAVLIAREMGLDPETVEKIRVAGILHDVGKIALPDQVLLKQEGLTDEEYEVMKSHARHTIRILERIHFHRDLEDVPQIAGAHHERLDGGGYPRGLDRSELTLPMRILAVADVFHALIQNRPYKKAFSLEEALEECRNMTGSYETHFGEESGAHLDGEVVEALADNLDREGTDDFRERAVELSGFTESNVFDPELNLPG